MSISGARKWSRKRPARRIPGIPISRPAPLMAVSSRCGSESRTRPPNRRCSISAARIASASRCSKWRKSGRWRGPTGHRSAHSPGQRTLSPTPILSWAMCATAMPSSSMGASGTDRSMSVADRGTPCCCNMRRPISASAFQTSRRHIIGPSPTGPKCRRRSPYSAVREVIPTWSSLRTAGTCWNSRYSSPSRLFPMGSLGHRSP